MQHVYSREALLEKPEAESGKHHEKAERTASTE